MDASWFSGLLTRVEIGHMRITSAGKGRSGLAPNKSGLATMLSIPAASGRNSDASAPEPLRLHPYHRGIADAIVAVRAEDRATDDVKSASPLAEEEPAQ
jgi:hypothetical protein